MEPLTVVGSGLAVLGSKDILTKLLGPTADYVGGEIRGFVEKCNVNLDNVFVKAVRKLGERLDEKGTVSARVLRHVVDEGRFCEDEIVAEYYGGVLASSRSPSGRDDRGVALLSVIKSLSVYQVRFHCLVYALMRQHYFGQDLNLGDQHDCLKMRLFIPTPVYDKAMEFSSDENGGAIMIHCLFGLKKQDLLHDMLSGDPDFLYPRFPSLKDKGPGMIVSPSILGAELYLWASGVSGASGAELLSASVPSIASPIEIVEGSFPLSVDWRVGVR